MQRSFVTLLALVACSGCASTSFDTYITVPAGRPTKPTPAEDSEEVKVLVETLPDGIALTNGALVADPERYETLGRIWVTRNKPLAANFGLWPYDFKEGERWRDALCTWQVPLSWVTVTLWAWISPTYWPCHVEHGSEEDRRETMVETMKRGTKLAGGNLLVVAGFGGHDFVKASADPTLPQQDGTGSLGGVGYAFRVKRPR